MEILKFIAKTIGLFIGGLIVVVLVKIALYFMITGATYIFGGTFEINGLIITGTVAIFLVGFIVYLDQN